MCRAKLEHHGVSCETRSLLENRCSFFISSHTVTIPCSSLFFLPSGSLHCLSQASTFPPKTFTSLGLSMRTPLRATVPFFNTILHPMHIDEPASSPGIGMLIFGIGLTVNAYTLLPLASCSSSLNGAFELTLAFALALPPAAAGAGVDVTL